MKKKLKLNELSVQSFITGVSTEKIAGAGSLGCVRTTITDITHCEPLCPYTLDQVQCLTRDITVNC